MESSTPQVDDMAQHEAPTKKRRPTEKRKLQNRIAQRKYRENLKSRLETLERQAAEIADQQNTTVPEPESRFQPQVNDPPASALEENSFDFLLDIDPENDANSFLPTDSEAFEIPNYPVFPNMESIFDNPVEAESSTPSKDRDNGNPSAPTPLDAEFEYDFYINQLSNENPLPSDPPNQFSQVRERPGYSPWGPGHVWSGGKSPAKTIDNFVRMTPDAGTISKMTIKPPNRPPASDGSLEACIKLAPTFASELVRQLRLDDSKENHSLVRTAIARGYNIRDVFLAGLSSLDKQETLRPRKGFDLYNNTLTLVPTSTLQAYLSNAMAMKLPIHGLKNETFQSPFYQPEALAAGNMAALEAIWNEIPKALRPTRGQITVPHHPWMDMIPFPTLRDRALTLSALNPPIIDIDDFKNDVFMNCGMFCWRTGGTGGSGQPWDMRSWEAEPWFLKKWWILVGGETGEVWEQTQWWRALRGKSKVEMDGAAK
ncbi:uncharacterized protein LY89DRAFT_727941 [Mollisia scopiformis]|uniref:BZIP domain-containing protein n=1 Tax=Mollisia scopiformis TaxID=149040 RepID=A0A194XTY5_MOLSC|nr:uncharacterized protein LY89DRAFT_727941 [Mollisia scopiformis]KUJ23167.1 hypothetical protein LY89DRAFT_727941 [Mollisia scopiformis]